MALDPYVYTGGVQNYREQIMNDAIAVFVKTPGLSPLKTRLGATLGTENAVEFFLLSVNAVAETVVHANADIYWAVAESEALDHPLWQNFRPLHTGEGDLGERQHRVYETLLKKYGRVLLIGADTPQLPVVFLDKAFSALNSSDFVIGPARDGGYYLFGGRTSTKRKTWSSVRWSTGRTLQDLEAGLPSTPVRLPLLTDIDTEEDLRYLAAEMPETPSKEQRLILKWIENSERSFSLHG